LKELELDETLENYVEEERLAITCFWYFQTSHGWVSPSHQMWLVMELFY
jgi:hypothetical protein